jgi:hypothetical protein
MLVAILKLTSDIFAMELDRFINLGYGWICKQCGPNQETRAKDDVARARFFSEGEAEQKEPALSSTGLARWRDASRQVLYCPVCGVEELVDKA